MKTKLIEDGDAYELHLHDDTTKKSFYKIFKKVKRDKNVKYEGQVDGFWFLINTLVVNDQKVEFFHDDDIGNYFKVDDKSQLDALEYVQEIIDAL